MFSRCRGGACSDRSADAAPICNWRRDARILGGMNARAVFLLPLLLTNVLAQESPIAWQSDLVAARKLAAERHAPLFVVFRCER
jgi:hypothetical protein